jgi:hypothetical protein
MNRFYARFIKQKIMDNKILKELRERFKKETGKKVGELGKVYSLEYTQWLQKELVKKLTIPVVPKQSELLLCGFCEVETEHIVYNSGNLQCKKCDWVAKP